MPPPIYQWACEKCGKKVDILRHWDLCQDPPNEEEASKTCEKNEAGHEWDKKLGATTWQRGPNFGPGKGHW